MIRTENDLQKIIAFLTTEFGIPYETVVSKTRKQDIVFIRSVLSFLFYYSATLTSKEIGIMMGRDHTTVLAHLRKIEKLRQFKHPRVCEILAKWNNQ